MKKRALLALLPALLLLASAAALFAQPTEQAFAQLGPQVHLVGNIAESSGTTRSLESDHAQAFTTGSNSTGYALQGVDFMFSSLADTGGTSKMTAAIYSDSSGSPGTIVDTLTTPAITAITGDHILGFSASSPGTELAADTTYWVVLDVSAAFTGNNAVRNTASDAEDSGGAAGWSIANDSRHRTRASTGAWTTSTESMKLRLVGAVNPIPPKCTTANAQGAYLVPEDWALNPSGSSTGDTFRLLFQTSISYSPTATDIAHYNTEVQTRAKAGSVAISDSCGDLFRIVGSTSAVDARDNTGTTGTGEPIYWLNGAKLADDYADFYDGSWDDYGGRNEHGNTEGGDVWTGSNQDGTKHSTEYLGATGDMRVGTPQSGDNPINSYSDDTSSSNDYYGLSPVFIVGPPTLSISIKGGHTDIDEGGARTVVFTLDSPAPPGGILLGDPGIPIGGILPVDTDLIPAGQTTKEYTLNADDDTEYTPGRVLTLTYPNNNNLRTSGSLTITLSVNDDDEPLLVSNLGQTSTSSTSLLSDLAQAFTTGGNVWGYTLTSADVVIRDNSDSALSSKLIATIRSDSGRSPGAVIGTLTTPAIPTTTTNQTFKFTAPVDGIDLAANTKYWLVLDTTGVPFGVSSVRTTSSLAEDSGGAAGFSFADDVWRRLQGDTSWSLFLANRVLLVGINGLVAPVTANADGSYTVPDDWALIPQGFGPGDRFRLMFMTQGMESALWSDITRYDTYVQGEATTGHTAIRPYADTFKVVGSTSAVDARDHLGMTGAGHPVHWLRGPRIADGNSEFWSNNWQNWTIAHRRNAGGNQMTGSARNDWHWTGTRVGGTAHPILPLGSNDRVLRGRFQANTGDRNPLDHIGTPRGQDHSFYAMSPVFRVDGLTHLDPGSNPQSGVLFEFDKTSFKVDEPAECGVNEGRKQHDFVRDDAVGRIVDTSYSYGVRLLRDPGNDTVKLDVVGGSPPDWWTAHREGFVTVEDKAPAIEPKQVLHFDSSNWDQWQNVQLRIHCADHFHFGDVPWRQFRHVSYTNNQRRNSYLLFPNDDYLAHEEPVVRVKVYDNRIPALKDSYDRALSMQPDTHEVGREGDETQKITYVYWQWKAPGATDNDDTDADLYFSHWHMRLLADNSVGGNAPDHVKNVSTDDGYSFLPDGDYKAGMRMRGLPPKTTPGIAPPPKQYRLDITPVTLRGEMAEGAKLTVCIEMRDVRPDWDTPNWRAFYIPCTPALNALSPQQMAPPVTPTVFIAGAGGGDEGQGSVFFINANPKPRSPLQVNVEVTATGDYGVTPGTRTITIPTSGIYDLHIPTVDDEVDEPDGTVTLTLREGDGYQVGPGNTETTDVFDNDLPLAPALVTPQVSVTSASGGNEGEDAVFTLESSPKTDAALDVSIEVTATGDYGVKTGTHTVTIPASGSLRLTIATRNDGQDEPDGTVTVTLAAGDGYDVGAPASGTADILDNDLPPVRVTVADAIAQEGDDLEFVISLDRAADHQVIVHYVTLDWDAWHPDDYAQALGHVTFEPGETQQTVRVPTVVDDQDEWGNEEGQERMLFQVAGVEGGEDGAGETIGIISDDPVDTTPKPELSISGGPGISEGGTATFTITASFAPEDPITVKVGVSQNGDFGAAGTATVSVSGATTAFTVNTHDDANDEPDGSVTATLQAGSGYTVSSSNGAATVSVSDDDLPPPVASITGGNGITEGGTASFTLTVNPAPSSPITVNVGVSQSGDFGAAGAATVSVSGASTSYTITTSDDSTDEPDGSVTATLKSGQGYTVSSSQGSATVAVADNDLPPPTPEVNVTNAISGPEGQDVVFILTANPTPAANLPVSVTVTASGDYGVTTGTWVETIPPGRNGGSVTVTLTTTDDSTDEPNGSVTLTLNGGSGYTVGSLSSETVTVTDNDEPRQQQQLPDPEVSITAGSGITEGGTATFTITANPAPSSPITVQVAVSQNGDFGATGAATVQVSGATTTYTVTTTDDSTDEADGSVTATLQTGSGYTVSSSQGAASVAVSDDDHPTPEVSITAGSGITEGGMASFTITASPAPASPITVKVGISQSGDFGASGAATVQVSGATTTYTVTTSDDSTDEADGSVTATLQTGSGYTVSSSQGAATVNVADDDHPTPEVSITAGSGITEGGTASFTITASPVPASPITVKVGVSEDGDFGASGAATVNVSGASTTYTITTTDDSTDEADGSVTATLQTGSSYTVSSSQGAATVAVADDDVPEVSITAGSGITEGGTATFTITASPVPASPITVNVGVSQSGDFGASGAATVQVSGASTTYTVTTTDDSTDEADGSVTATLQTGQGYTVSSSQGAATVAVSDDDAPAEGNSDTLTVSIADSESASPGEFLRFTVSASEPAQQEVTVTFGVEQIGGLVQGLDYCILSSDEEPADGFRCMSLPYGHDNEGGQVTIAEGEDSAAVYIWIDRDARVPSGSPQIFVHLAEVEGAKGITENLASGRVTE